MRTPLILVLALLLAAPASASPRPAPEPLAAEALRHLQAYLRLDTTNPPGRERTAALFMYGLARANGLESQVYDLGEGRANVLTTWKGTGARRPVILLHHMDVVPAEARAWSVPPFAGLTRGDYVYGRGAVDIKGKGIIDLMAVLALKRAGVRLQRDVMLLAVADEEESSIGSRWMIAHQAERLKRAEFLIDEGASVRPGPAGQPPSYLVSYAEKTPVWLTVSVKGHAGHGSLPGAGDAPERAIAIASRLLALRPAPHVPPALAGYVKLLLGERALAGLPGYAGDLDAALGDPAFCRGVADRYPEVGAAMGDTLALTRLHAGDKINTIPNQASIGLDCRLLPGTDREAFIRRVRAAIADPAATLTIEDTGGLTGSPASPVDGTFVAALARVAARHDPGAPVVPMVLLSSTDSAFYRAIGLQAYGFEPYALSDGDSHRAHGNDERLPIAEIAPAIAREADLLRELDR